MMADIPYGYCHCGCGGKTRIARNTDRHQGWVKDEPIRFIRGHQSRTPPQKYKYGDTVPSGICHCGCGQRTKIAMSNDKRDGTTKGQPVRYVRGHNHAMPRVGIPAGMKRCTKCKVTLPLSVFTRRPISSDGHSSICKGCRCTWSKNNYGTAKQRAVRRQWLRDNPEKKRAWVQNRRARKMANGGTITAAQWQSVLDRFDGKCAKCDSPENIHMDHVVPLSKGGAHSVDNVQPLCRSCNSRKHTKIEDYRGKLYEPLALPLEEIAT